MPGPARITWKTPRTGCLRSPESSTRIRLPDPTAGSPAPIITGLYGTGKSQRKTEVKRIFDSGKPSRLPNAVEAEVDVEALLNERFLADALLELRGRPGVIASGDDPLSFEVVLVETLRTEAGGLFDQIKAKVDALTDLNKQVLVLSSKPILLTVDAKKPREEFYLVQLTKKRANIERLGIALSLPAAPEPAEETAA